MTQRKTITLYQIRLMVAIGGLLVVLAANLGPPEFTPLSCLLAALAIGILLHSLTCTDPSEDDNDDHGGDNHA